MKKALILFPVIKKADSANYLGFVDYVRAHASKEIDLQYTGAALTELSFHIGSAASIVLPDGSDLRDFDVVLFRSWQKSPDLAATCADYLRYHGIPFVDSEVGYQASLSKLSEAMRLSLGGIRVPETLFTKDEQAIRAFCTQTPAMVAKDIMGEKGKDNHLFKDVDELLQLVSSNPDKQYIIQPYIPNDGDYRFVVANGRIVFVMKRQSRDGGHLHNVSRGGRAQQIALDNFSKDQQAEVTRAAHIMRREFAGVDVMIHAETQELFVLEVNYSPQVLTGAFIESMMEPVPAMLKEVATKKENAL